MAQGFSGARPRAESLRMLPWTGAELAGAGTLGEHSRGRAHGVAYLCRAAAPQGTGAEKSTQVEV